MNISKKILLAVFLIALVYLYTLLSTHSTDSMFKEFIFKSVDKKVLHVKVSKNHIQIKEFQGNVVFFKVFGLNCPYCKKEIPELIKVNDRFKTVLKTLAIESQHHTPQENIDFIKKNNINYTIVSGDAQEEFLDYLQKVYSWDGTIPLTIVIDPDGKILAFEVGSKSYSLTSLLETTLRQLTTVAVPKK